MITLSDREWNKLRPKVFADYPISVMLIREVMKRELGFTVREHRWYTEQHGYQNNICLDFYDDSKETWFRLKYL